MKRGVAAAVVVGLLASAGPGRAQFWPGPGWNGGYGGYYARGNFAVSFGGPNFSSRSVTAQVVVSRPFLPYGSYLPPPPPPGWGGVAWVPPPVVVVPPPAVAVNPAAVFPPNPDVAALNAPDPPKAPANEKDFLVFRPGQQPPKLVANVPVPKPPAVPPPPAPVRPPLDAAGDQKADPKAEAARQVELAKAAFAAGEYGRAAERLAAAARAKPDEPLPYFLLAQVRFARGEYAEAVAAVRDGMNRAPDWPAATFRPKELYGDKPDRFDVHLAELRQALAANPGDPALAFLLGYQLWFTGGRDEAVRLFRRVTKQVKDNVIVEQFLLDADAKVVGR